MRNLVSLFSVLAAGTAVAEEWHASDAESLVDALIGAQVRYENGHRQFFYDNGTTDYSTGSAPSLGNWELRDGDYCSQWPPQEDWDCYKVSFSADGARIRFLDDYGNEYIGKFLK